MSEQPLAEDEMSGSKRSAILAMLIGVISGCVVVPGVHPTLHPSVQGNVPAAGVSAGLMYGMPDEGSGHVLQVPYGEGWARFVVGDGQLELRVTPGLGYLGYRLNVASAQEHPIGVALIPSFGAGYWHGNFAVDEESDDTNMLAIAPNLTVLLGFGQGRAYLAPRFAYLRFQEFGAGGGSTDLFSFGANFGYTIDADPFDYSFEFAFQRISPRQQMSSAVYMIVPTLGIQM
jgi:hypothetical protein